MRCCENCTIMDVIKQKILTTGEYGNCNSCNSINVRFLEINEINDDIRQIVFNSWVNISSQLKYNNRFFLGSLFETIFTPALFSVAHTVSKDIVLYRSRLEGKTDSLGNTIEPFAIDDMWSPPIHKSRSGRVNAKGITCLYAATDVETAIAELRPWKNAPITVARLITNKELILIDLATINRNIKEININQLTLDGLLNYYSVYVFGYELSRPVPSSDINEIEYVPTQVISEFIKYKGYDGIIYRSSLGSGDNIALFRQESVSMIDTSLYTVSSISYDIQHIQR